MGREELQALARVIEEQLALGANGVVVGAWSIRWDKERQAFEFDKCEFAGYCQERPSVVSLTGPVLDPGGPLVDA
jgi:hypothetical protein